MKFKKKPEVIEAMRYDGSISSASKIIAWAHRGLPPKANAVIRNLPRETGALIVRTPHGEPAAYPGDWVIKTANGAFAVMKHDVFSFGYEPAE